MPVSYRIDHVRGVVFSRAHGRVRGEDFLAHQRQLAQDPDFRPDLKQLFDTRGITDFDFTSEVIRSLVRDNPFGEGARRAFVASSDVVYGAARMFELITDGQPHETAVFRTLEEARDWLGLAPEEG